VDFPDFAALAARGKPSLDELALALAAEFRPVDAEHALAELDRLGKELRDLSGGSPEDEAEACRQLLGERHGLAGDRERYDHPDNSMLDLGGPVVVASAAGGERDDGRGESEQALHSFLHSGPGRSATSTPRATATRASPVTKTFDTPLLEPGGSVSPRSG